MYPDTPAILRAAEAGLADLARLGWTRRARGDLVNTGLAGTDVEGTFSADILRWMAHPDPVMTWSGEFLSGADDALSLLLLPPERDAILHQGLSTRELWHLAAGRHPVRWILDRVAAIAPDPEARERLVDGLHLAVRWRLGDASRTLTRFPARPLFFQTAPLVRQVALGAHLAKRLPPQRPAANGAGTALIGVARATLAARARETDTITWANPDEVELFRLDRGVDVALIGLAPSRRLPVESYFGFVAARNRVPIAYGGGWVFFRRCEIGVNLFPEFRGGESAFIFAQVLRAYRQRYRVRQFLVDPYQFGKANPEAIRSGAFWFYYRLGFRPTDPEVSREATTEWSRLNARRGYQTSAARLRRFTASPLFLDVGPLEAGVPPALDAAWYPVAPDLPALGLALTRWIGEQHQGDRRRAQAESVGQVRRVLGAPARSERGSEREWYQRLAPLVAMIPELGGWPPRERHRLAAALAAKGGTRERDYALRLQQLPRLRLAWQRAAARPPSAPA